MKSPSWQAVSSTVPGPQEIGESLLHCSELKLKGQAGRGVDANPPQTVCKSPNENDEDITMEEDQGKPLNPV